MADEFFAKMMDRRESSPVKLNAALAEIANLRSVLPENDKSIVRFDLVPPDVLLFKRYMYSK